MNTKIPPTVYPHGRCECPCPAENCGGVGPAFLRVSRVVRGAPTELNVCSRCHLPDDRLIKVLITKESPGRPFVEWDPLTPFILPNYLPELLEGGSKQAAEADENANT